MPPHGFDATPDARTSPVPGPAPRESALQHAGMALKPAAAVD